MIGVCIFSIIISKFDYKQKLGSIVLLKIDKYIKIRFYDAILPFSLTINLKVKCIEKLMLGFKKIIKR